MALAATTRILANRKNLSTTLHFTGNDTVTIAGNSTTSEIATGNEILTGATITQLWHGSDGVWIVKRGSNTVGVFDSTAYIDFAGCGNALNLDTDATLSVELVGTANGYLMIELQKIGPLTANSEYFQV